MLMGSEVLAIAAVLLCALGRRVCGGLYNSITGKRSPGGDLPVRIFFAATLAAAAWFGGLWWVWTLVLIPLNFIGTTTGLFDALAMGHGGNSLAKDFINMTAHGVLSSVPPAIFLLVCGVWPALIVFAGGLVISPCYMLGWSITGLNGRKSWPKGMQQGTEIAELLWGGCMGLAHYGGAVLC